MSAGRSGKDKKWSLLVRSVNDALELAQELNGSQTVVSLTNEVDSLGQTLESLKQLKYLYVQNKPRIKKDTP